MSSIVVWRLVAERHAATAFSGEGARKYGARWSLSGLNVVYCSESRSLAALEIIVNARNGTKLAGEPWAVLSAEIPQDLVERPTRVPDNWREYPHPRATQEFGAKWLREQRSAVLRVPSVVVLGEFNYLLNPAHADFAKLRIGKPEPFSFDPRLNG
ncbi:MAG: RES family NAD+ phosphorylase [Opitutaceae bacterium]